VLERKPSPRRVPYSSRSFYDSTGRKIKGRGAVVSLRLPYCSFFCLCTFLNLIVWWVGLPALTLRSLGLNIGPDQGHSLCICVCAVLARHVHYTACRQCMYSAANFSSAVHASFQKILLVLHFPLFLGPFGDQQPQFLELPNPRSYTGSLSNR